MNRTTFARSLIALGMTMLCRLPGAIAAEDDDRAATHTGTASTADTKTAQRPGEALPGEAGATEAIDEARRRALEIKTDADAAMRSLRYREALSGYQRAYAVEPMPALLYNQARALQALERYAEALDFLERFAAEAPADLQGRVPALDALLDELRARIGTVRVTVRPSVTQGTLRIGDREFPLDRAGASWRVDAGDAEISLTSPGYRGYRRRVTLPAQRELRIEIVLEREVRPATLAVQSDVAGADRKGSVLETWWFWTGAGVVVVGATVLTVALTSEREPDEGTLGRVEAPLIRF